VSRLRPDESFRPPWWLRGHHLQSVLPSLGLRRGGIARRAAPLLAASTEMLLDCGDGVRLQAFHSRPPRHDGAAEGPVVVILHGWEGSAESLYILSLGQSLFEQGCDVVRLNLRDHGNTHHLNRELFHSCRLPEVVGAVGAIQQRFAGRRLALTGFSLGGNFMLRVGGEAPRAGLDIERVVAISPVLDPATTLDALEAGFPLYSRYFVLKWTRSLRLKQAAWPGEFDFDLLVRSRDLRRMTEDLVLQYAGYPDLRSYLAGYAITGERLAALTVPATLLTSLDDPIIPAADLARLPDTPQLRIVVTRHGGHCGFVERLGVPSWVDGFVLRELGALAAPRRGG
jgi:hypothetical protein